VACKDKSYKIKNDINTLKSQKDSIINGKEQFKVKIVKIEGEIEELTSRIDACEKKVVRLEKEKKKFAAEKKFKEAGKAQNEIKEATSELEEAQAKLKVSIKEKDRMELEAGSQDSIVEDIDK
jgi:chromosome segregation ATPase